MTLKDVAQKAGVSAHSVSAVLNGKAEQYRISPATQQRIAKMAAELGYDPDNNRGARQMAARKHGIKMLNNVIAVCSNPSSRPVHQQPFESEILDGIESVADAQGLDVLMCRLRADRLPRMIEKCEVDGIVTMSSQVQWFPLFRPLGIPVVHLGSMLPEIHSVSAEHRKGMKLVVSHLIEQGHRQIAYIGYGVNLTQKESVLYDAANQRYESFCEVMEKSGLPVKYVVSSLPKGLPENGYNSFDMLWKQSRRRLTAVVCYNDFLAMGAIRAAQEKGLQVPHDLSVVGFDAVSGPFAFEPFITSVGYDRALMGRRAMEILLEYRHEKILSPEDKSTFIREELPVHFVEGATTAPPAKKKL